MYSEISDINLQSAYSSFLEVINHNVTLDEAKEAFHNVKKN